METTQQLYQRAKIAAGIGSDYGFAKRFGVSTQVVSNWQGGKRSFDDDHAALIAGILDLEPGYVMACCHAERAKSDKSRSNWIRIAALLAAATLPPTAGAAAHNAGNFSQSNQGIIRIMSTSIRRIIVGSMPLPA